MQSKTNIAQSAGLLNDHYVYCLLLSCRHLSSCASFLRSATKHVNRYYCKWSIQSTHRTGQKVCALLEQACKLYLLNMMVICFFVVRFCFSCWLNIASASDVHNARARCSVAIPLLPLRFLAERIISFRITNIRSWWTRCKFDFNSFGEQFFNFNGRVLRFSYANKSILYRFSIEVGCINHHNFHFSLQLTMKSKCASELRRRLGLAIKLRCPDHSLIWRIIKHFTDSQPSFIKNSPSKARILSFFPFLAL